jgi:hypothetical protein
VPKITISPRAKKASKKAAYDMAVKLKQGETLSSFELDSLLLYFAPSIPKTAKTSMEWVAKAAAKKDNRKYLEYVRVQDGTAYAVDGERIHYAPSDLPEGWYCPKTLMRLEGVNERAPDYLRVSARANTVNAHATLGELSKGTAGNKVYLFHDGLDVGVREQALIDALNSQDENATFEYEPYNSHFRVRGSHEFGEFVIMPLRV